MSDTELIEEKYAEAVKGIKEEWFTESDTKWHEYVIGLPIQLQICYLIVVFHNQILNGGFINFLEMDMGNLRRKLLRHSKP